MHLLCDIMLLELTVLASLGSALAGYADSSSNNVGNGYGYGFSGSFSGQDNIQAPPIPQLNFDGAFGGYFDSLRKYHEHFINNGGGSHSYAITSSSSNANAQAQSSITFSDNFAGIQQAATAGQGYAGGYPSYVPSNAGGNYEGGGGYGSSFGGSFSGNNGGSLASASIDGNGVHQTAAVYPENPNAPNIFNRFAEINPQNGGSYGVFTSSISSSSNVNGKPESFHQASTTINDNGKVTTYTVKNP